MGSAKTDKPIEMLFRGRRTRAGPRNHVLDRDAHLRLLANTMDRSVRWR